MKKFLLVVMVALIIIAVFLVLYEKNNSSNNDSKPQNEFTQEQEPTGENIQGSEFDQKTKDDIRRAYENQVEAPIPRTLGNTYVFSGYAIQLWSDENSGGEILFKQSADKKDWIRIGADSVWSEEYLIKAGVPVDVANKLYTAKSKE